MIHIPWKDRYNINYKDIDDQHKGLVSILNELVDRRGSEQVTDIIHRLCQYALTHFAQEERYMASAGYSDLVRHQAEHATFINQLLELNRSYEPDDPRLAEATFAFVKDWYLRHIIQTDHEYVNTLKSYHSRAKIQAIIFKLDVLCSTDENRFMEAAASLIGRSVDEIRTLIEGQPSLFRGYAAGFLDSGEFLARCAELFGTELPEMDFIRAYSKVLVPVEPVIDSVRRLKPRYKLGLVADITPLRYENALMNLDILPLFDAVTLSWEVKATMPDPALFNDIVCKLDLLAEECIHVDDRPAHAIAATGHLLHGVSVSGAESLREALRRQKVDI